MLFYDDIFAWKLLFLFEDKIKSAIDWPFSFLVFTDFQIYTNIIAANTLTESFHLAVETERRKPLWNIIFVNCLIIHFDVQSRCICIQIVRFGIVFVFFVLFPLMHQIHMIEKCTVPIVYETQEKQSTSAWKLSRITTLIFANIFEIPKQTESKFGNWCEITIKARFEAFYMQKIDCNIDY